MPRSLRFLQGAGVFIDRTAGFLTLIRKIAIVHPGTPRWPILNFAFFAKFRVGILEAVRASGSLFCFDKAGVENTSEVVLNEEDGMKSPCPLNLHNAITVSQQRLGKRVAQLSSARMNEVCAALRFSLGCDSN